MSHEALTFRSADIEDIGALALLTERAHAYRNDQPLPEQAAAAATVVDLQERLDRAAARALLGHKNRLMLWTRQDDNDHTRAIYEHKGFRPARHTRYSKYGRQVLYLLDI